MKANQLLRFGGVCGILVGLFNFLASVIYLFLPAAQKLGSPGAELLPSVAQGAGMLILLHLGFTLIGIFGLGFAPGLTELVRTPGNEGWLRWASTLALVGYAVSAVSGPLVIDHVPRVAAAYVAGDAATKAALLPVWRGSLDPFALWSYGAVGLWIVIVSLAGFGMARGGLAAKLLCGLGVLVGLLHLLVPLGFVIKLPVLFTLIAALGALGTTLWAIWAGVALLMMAGQGNAPAAPATR